VKQPHFKQSKICCISDIHLGVHQNSANWHKILLDWTRWLNTELKSHGIQDIMISGDLFHSRNEIAVNSLHVATEFLQILQDYNIVMITGNHDCYYKDNSLINSLSILKGWSNITVLDTPYDDIFFGTHIQFAPWGTQIKDITKCDLIFGHFELIDFKMNNFKVCDHGDDPTSLLQKARKIITGHFHLREHRKYSEGEVIYLGNPYQMDFGDAGSTKGWYELDIQTLKTVFHENTISPKHIKLPISRLITYDPGNSQLTNLIKDNIVKLVVDKNVESDDLDILTTYINSLKPYIYNVDYDINYNKFTVDELDYQYSGVDYETAITDFVEMLQINNKKEVIDYTINLYKSCIT
jgi:DNA repair exonuclease SbcCD nuclease subunit